MSKKDRKQLKQFSKQIDILKGSMNLNFKGLDKLMEQLPTEQQEILSKVRDSVTDAIATTDMDKLNDAIEEADKLTQS
jgi:RNA processing factor Prp31